MRIWLIVLPLLAAMVAILVFPLAAHNRTVTAESTTSRVHTKPALPSPTSTPEITWSPYDPLIFEPPEPTPEPTVAPPIVNRPVAAAVPVAAPVSTSAIHAAIAEYPWPYEQAVAVAMCESGLNPNAVSSVSAVGLFQIHPYNPANFDIHTNIAAAYSKYLDGVSRGNPWWHWNQWGSCGHF